jgi:hypothetical protein
MVFSLIFVLEIGVAMQAKAQTASSYDLLLKSRTVPVQAGMENYNRGKNLPEMQLTNLLSGRYHAVVQFLNSPTESQKLQITASGIILFDYIPNNSYTAAIMPELSESQLTALGIRSILFFEAGDKIDSRLQNESSGIIQGDPQKSDTYLSIYPDVPMTDAVNQLISIYQGEVLEVFTTFNLIHVRIPKSKLIDIARAEWVSWIEGSLPLVSRNDGSRALIKVNEVQAAPFNLTGSGVRLGIWDGGSVATHTGFSNRLTIKNNVAVDGHATHVAGTMAGNGANSPNNNLRGMATSAGIYSWTYVGKTYPAVAQEMISGVDNDAIVLSQNSWGTNSGNGSYTEFERLMDQVVREKNIPVVFAIGY